MSLRRQLMEAAPTMKKNIWFPGMAMNN